MLRHTRHWVSFFCMDLGSREKHGLPWQEVAYLYRQAVHQSYGPLLAGFGVHINI
jgi:hypothetical protein